MSDIYEKHILEKLSHEFISTTKFDWKTRVSLIDVASENYESVEVSCENYEKKVAMFEDEKLMLVEILKIYAEELHRFTPKEQVILGLWKPLNTVKDTPLAVMDASSFKPEDAVPQRLVGYAPMDEGEDVPRDERSLNGGYKLVDGTYVSARARLREGQKYYYFSDMDASKLLVFTHFTRHRDWCNVHGSIKLPTASNAPKRQSFEVRARLFYVDESAWEEFEAERES